MNNFEVPEPILNSPFIEPAHHWRLEEGQPPEKLPGRREAGYFYRDPRAPQSEGEHEARGRWEPLVLVNRIREQLKAWRGQGWPGVSRTGPTSSRA
jgi:type III restriction enzyme